ncbi:MAG: hypothetical protein Kow0047_31050 [Anaerolineae bacterium]
MATRKAACDMRMKQIEAAYAEGAAARDRDVPLRRSPYSPRQWSLYMAWRMGWLHRDGEIRKSKTDEAEMQPGSRGGV